LYIEISTYCIQYTQQYWLRKKNHERIWVDEMPRLFGLAVPDFVDQPLKTLPDNCRTPYDYHKLFLDDEFVDEMVRTSRLYAVRKNKPEVQQKITNNSIRTSVAVMHMTGYLTPSNRNMYWEQREDTMNSFVRKALSRNMFIDIIQHSYFVDSVTPDSNDRFWKVRPLFKQINKTAKAYVKQPRNVSIDEGMVKYFGPHPLKQYMRGKPCRFGYKVSITFYMQQSMII
jgi:hypothetical protein